jgi:integrase/recombinase XerD
MGSPYCGAFSRSIGDLQLERVTPDAVKLFIDAGRTANVRCKRHRMLRMFYEYWAARGEIAKSPLPPSVPKVTRTFVPYIYTRAEIEKLLNATPLSQQRCWCAMSAQTFRTLLLFLYGTGLRLGEALRLEYRHLNMAEALLTIEQTKFYKSRLVPVGPDVQRILADHLAQQKTKKAPFVFQNELGHPLKLDTVNGCFHRLRRLAGIVRSDFTTYEPRLHDLRHTFAVHRLIAWYKQGKDVQQLLPALSTYLAT